MQDEKGKFAARDWVGHKSGKLTVARHLDGRDQYGYQMLELLCACGSTIVRSAQCVSRSKPLQSCGCGPKGRPPISQNGSVMRFLWMACKRSAHARGYSFELTEADIRALVLQSCFWCGLAPQTRTFSALGGASLDCNGIDRRDNALGYTPANCVPCCEQCNRAKLDYSEQDFKEWIRRAYEHIYG